MIAAVVYMCLLTHMSECQQTSVRVEPRVCHTKPIRAQAPIMNAWRDVVVGVRCK